LPAEAPKARKPGEPDFPAFAPYLLVTFEQFAAVYFLLIALLGPFSGAPARRAAVVSLTAFGLAASIAALTRLLTVDARVWIGPLYLAAGYWLPALLVTRSPGAFEAWLRSTEPAAARSLRLRGHLAELAYLCCYPLVPAAFIAVDTTGSIADVDRFWTSVLGAGFLCYISLPWLVSRPPRVLEDAIVDASPVRHINLHVLDRFSHGWNTFPSGHVAIAVAAALSVMSVTPHVGIVFPIVATGIVVGSVSGRYHYTIDAVAGIVVGVAAYVGARFST
jgi:PAP2 superfamily protein